MSTTRLSDATEVRRPRLRQVQPHLGCLRVLLLRPVDALLCKDRKEATDR